MGHFESPKYRHIRPYLENGDMMVLRNPGSVGWFTRSPGSHIGTLAWRESDDQATLLVAESREFKGGRCVSFKSQVEQYPGLIDVYRPTSGCPTNVRERAATIAVNWAGHSYNYPGIWDQFIAGLPIARYMAERLWKKRFDFNDMTLSDWHAAKYCSQLYGWSYRRAAYELGLILEWDVAPGIGDKWITPGHLMHSGAFQLVARSIQPSN